MANANHTEKLVNELYRNLERVLFFAGESKNIDFYISSLTEHNPFYSTKEIAHWLESLNRSKYFTVQQVPLTELDKWSFNKDTGNLEHVSGGFFSIRGLRVKTNMGSVPEWSQPIIYQPEIGLLGILTKKINGILYFLLQAKAEPGNVNTYQLSPTVQATRSNYTRIHGGKVTRYLEYFMGDRAGRVLIDQLQSEQGARFFAKRNRNMIVRLRDDDEDIELGPYHRWLTLGQIHALTQKNNTINMDTRSVISEINFDPERVNSLQPVDAPTLKATLEQSPIVQKPLSDFAIALMVSSHLNTTPMHTMEELLQKITQEKCKITLERTLIPLKQITGWIHTPDEIFHESQKYFSIIGVRIRAQDREVSSWDQPIVRQHHAGIVGFITKEINGVVHFLVQLKMESGVMDLLEMAPTVQCITDNYTPTDMPRFTEHFLKKEGTETIADAYQSEEGGRFYQESNHNIVLQADQNFPADEPPFFMWVSLRQLKEFIKFNNFINVEARSLLASLKMV